MERLPDYIVYKIMLYNSTLLADILRPKIDYYDQYYIWFKNNFSHLEPENFYKMQTRYNRYEMMLKINYKILNQHFPLFILNFEDDK